MSDWPFAEPPDLGVITTRQVLDGAPVRLVSHDEDDGGWQFLCGTTSDPADGRIVHLSHVVNDRPQLAAMADLPLGWVAAWCEEHGAWHRRPAEDDAED
ncbi:hypothetical protein ACI79J_01390 [Geodermatophilus sp. SYSU D01062]